LAQEARNRRSPAAGDNHGAQRRREFAGDVAQQAMHRPGHTADDAERHGIGGCPADAIAGCGQCRDGAKPRRAGLQRV